MADESDRRGAAEREGWPRAGLEILAIAAIFAAAGCWPVPDVNETAYLTKARHEADPAYAAGDFFLQTPAAHGVFYLAIGPLAAAASLETAAWIGRVAGWLALAFGFRHLAVPLVAPPSARGTWARLVAAAVFSLALRHGHMAGEWVIGGCEAKVFAWALVLGGLGEVVRDRFGPAWLLLGAAAAFHPLVGGWSLLAAAAAWWAGPRRPHPGPTPAITVAYAAAGLTLAAAGVLPALGLSADADAATRAAAVRTYVVERLPHHLLPRGFPTGFMPRHLLAIICWWLLDRLAVATPARRRLTAFVIASLGITLTGLAIAAVEPWAPAAVYGLLRYYWFRLGDVTVPLALAFAAATVLADDLACRRLAPLPPRSLRLAATLLILVDLAAESRHWPLPGRTLPARSDAKVEPAAWADVCTWVRDHAPPGTVVLTPRGAASFTWRTGLPEVVSWKNSPQDATSLVAWRRRMTDCFSADGSFVDLERSTAALGATRLGEVADRYGARLAIVPLDAPGVAELPFERLYANDGYVVLGIGD